MQHEEAKDETVSTDSNNHSSPKRNLFVQYKAFPGLEKLKTSVAWQEREPRFSYRSQFPVIVNPDTIDKL